MIQVICQGEDCFEKATMVIKDEDDEPVAYCCFNCRHEWTQWYGADRCFIIGDTSEQLANRQYVVRYKVTMEAHVVVHADTPEEARLIGHHELPLDAMREVAMLDMWDSFVIHDEEIGEVTNTNA